MEIAELHAETRAHRRNLRTGVGSASEQPAREWSGFSAARTIGTAGTLVIGTSVLSIRSLLPAGAQELTDGDIAVFAESVELAAVEAYEAAAGSGMLQPGVVEVGTTFAGHHAEHAKAFAGAAGDKATGKPNAMLLEAVRGQLGAAADQAAILTIAYDLENAAAATYLFALGALRSEAALALTASILPVESQHAVVLGSALGRPATEYVPSFESQAAAVDPAEFPAA